MRAKTAILFYNWFVNAFAYYGLTLNMGQVSCDWWTAGHVTTMLTSDWLAADGRGGHLPELHGVGAARDPRLPRRHPHPALLGPQVSSHWWSVVT